MNVDGNNNVQINGDGNTISHGKKAIALEKMHVILRNAGIDLNIGIGCLFLCMLALMYIKINISTLVPYLASAAVAIYFVYYFLISKIFPFFHITLKEDKMIVNNEEILFSEIKRFEQTNNNFRFSLGGRPEKMIRLILKSVDDSKLIYDTVYRYALASDTLLYNR